MSRYRPPAARKSPYITPVGMQALQQEQKAIWLRRRDVVAALSAAAAEGDRSENAEYIYRKKELGGLDRRIRYLQKRLPELKVVEQKPAVAERVFFGAWVMLENEAGAVVTYRIVGPDEFDHQADYISVDSPLAQSLMKKDLGDEISLEVPQGQLAYRIIEINY